MKLMAYYLTAHIKNTGYDFEELDYQQIVYIKADNNYSKEFMEILSNTLAKSSTLFGNAEKTLTEFTPLLINNKYAYADSEDNPKSGILKQDKNKVYNYNPILYIPTPKYPSSDKMWENVDILYKKYLDNMLSKMDYKDYNSYINKENNSINKKLKRNNLSTDKLLEIIKNNTKKLKSFKKDVNGEYVVKHKERLKLIKKLNDEIIKSNKNVVIKKDQKDMLLNDQDNKNKRKMLIDKNKTLKYSDIKEGIVKKDTPLNKQYILMARAQLKNKKTINDSDIVLKLNKLTDKNGVRLYNDNDIKNVLKENSPNFEGLNSKETEIKFDSIVKDVKNENIKNSIDFNNRIDVGHRNNNSNKFNTDK